MWLNLCFKIHALRVEWARSMKPGVLGAREGPGRKCEEYFYDQSKLHTAPAPDAKFQIPFQPVKSFSEY